MHRYEKKILIDIAVLVILFVSLLFLLTSEFHRVYYEYADICDNCNDYPYWWIVYVETFNIIGIIIGFIFLYTDFRLDNGKEG